jgi:peptidoglycan hydrolase-like protein with peptidoglycan-binding domain
MKKFLITISAACLAFALIVGNAEAAIVGTMKAGSRGLNVSALQQFLASNPDIYPQGMVTGYYGPLTRAAVIQFQLHYNLTADGIAGPMTVGKLNSVMAAGRGLDIYAPMISAVRATTSNTSANVSFSTSEPARAYINYDRNALSIRDASSSFSMPLVSGSSSSTTAFSNNSSLSISGLNQNTTYNYMLMAVDQSGNVNVVLPSTFRTGS